MASLDGWISTQVGADGKPLGNAEFGRRVSASEATISRVRNGKQAASLALMRRIEAATGGAVTPNDLSRALTDPAPSDPNPHPQLQSA